MWHILLALLPLVGAAEPGAADVWSPMIVEEPAPPPFDVPLPCVWDPVTCPDPGVPLRPLPASRYFGAGLEASAFNLGWHATTAYVFDLEWSQISGESIRRNAEIGWEWDVDRFSTNQLAHPYHGAQFMALSKINGLTWWEALPIVAFSSWEWEQFLETELPSINDQITTTLGGQYFGELLWRLSTVLLDESTSGAPRLARELGAGLVNPFRGLDRLVTRKAWKRGPTRAPVPLAGEVSAGIEVADSEDHPTWRMRLHGEMRHGDAFARTTLRRPMDVFDLRLDLFATPNFAERGVYVFSTGAIAGRRVPLGKGDSAGFVGFFQTYDYAEETLFKVGGTAMGPGWWSRHRLGPRAHLGLKVLALGTILGGIDSPYLPPEIERDYILGPGVTLQGRGELGVAGLGCAFFETRRYWVHSASAPLGDEIVGLTSAGLFVDLHEGWGVGTELFSFDSHAWYDDHADYVDHEVRVRLHATKAW